MRILNYSAGYDTGGQGIRIKQGFDRWSGHEYRAVARRSSYINYPADLPVGAAERFGRWADVVHVSHRVPPFKRRDGRVDRIGQGKPLVVHWHGTSFRKRPSRRLVEARTAGAAMVVSTVDLTLISPDELEWLPTPYNLDHLAGYSNPQNAGTIRVGHSPTNRRIKSTEQLIAAVRELSRTHPVELVLIEHADWETTLRKKGTCDIYFDQVLLGYGNNAVEAWGMGIPVVAGAQPDTLAEMRNRFGELPFYEATETTIYRALADLCDPAVRAEYATRGKEHAARFHDDRKVVGQLERIYESI